MADNRRVTERRQATLVFQPGHERVLLVDDEEPVRDLLRECLERCGYQVETAVNGAEALRQVPDPSAIDVLVTDLVMPELGGQELARRMRSLRPSLPVLFISGFADQAVNGIGTTGTAFLHKPFTPRALTDTVRALLDDPSR